MTGGGAQLGATHSQSLEGWYATTPGIRVVAPSTPYDALGLLRAAFQDSNPVLFAEHALLYATRGEVPDEYYTVPFGQADVKREGSDLTIVATSRMVRVALSAADQLAKSGVEAEVVDLRSLRPLDLDTVVASVRKTNRCLVVEETWQTGGFGGYVASAIQEVAFDDLDGPVGHVGGVDVPMTYARNLESLAIPSESTIIDSRWTGLLLSSTSRAKTANVSTSGRLPGSWM